MSHVQVAVLCDKIASSSTPFTFLKEQKKKRKTRKDENKHHAAVDEFSSEHQFHKSNVITFVV